MCFGLNRCAVLGGASRPEGERSAGLSIFIYSSFHLVSFARVWSRCLQRIPTRKGVSHDISSPTHD
jgi:hypothetical protein